jgi:hypothetical protein
MVLNYDQASIIYNGIIHSNTNNMMKEDNQENWPRILKLACEDHTKHCCICSGCDIINCTIGVEPERCYLCGKKSYIALLWHDPEKDRYNHSNDVEIYVCSDLKNDRTLLNELRRITNIKDLFKKYHIPERK